MLRSLTIQNYALIDSLEVSFIQGMTAITGETGAGKSILLGALSLILGQRADTKALKDDAQKCVIEGCFDLKGYDLEGFFSENELDFEADTIVRREILPSGKTRAFINDTPVSIQLLKELGSLLIDIHSQHQNMLLADLRFQLKIVDILSGTVDLYGDYAAIYRTYVQQKSQLKHLFDERARNVQEEEFVRFQWNELAQANLIAEELGELEQEQMELTHAEEIKSSLYRVNELLETDETGVLILLRECSHTMQGLSRKVAAFEEMASRLESDYIDLKDLASECAHKADSVELNETRLEEVNNRLGLLFSLMQKHRAQNINELIELRDRLGTKLSEIDHFEEHIEAVQKQIKASEEQLKVKGTDLSQRRKVGAEVIEKEWMAEVSQLGMPNVKIKVHFEPREGFGETGLEEIGILFAANKNAPLQPIGETASGGEISRMMLVVKHLIAGKMALPTIIFDEIDTGVSGEIADKMGDIMVEMAENMQVICITHLPQIAAKGTEHLKVYKLDNETSTSTRLKRLEYEERVREIASMISGSTVTDAALRHAETIIR